MGVEHDFPPVAVPKALTTLSDGNWAFIALPTDTVYCHVTIGVAAGYVVPVMVNDADPAQNGCQYAVGGPYLIPTFGARYLAVKTNTMTVGVTAFALREP